MFPIHCIVELIHCAECSNCCRNGTTLADSYAIVSGQTPLSQLVEAVLAALGLPYLADGAQGKIQINNWKPLAFDEITADPEQTIDFLLKDVSNHVTLRILAKQPQVFEPDDLKAKLLRLLLQVNPHLLNCIPDGQLRFAESIVQTDTTGSIAASNQSAVGNFHQWCDTVSKAFTKLTQHSSAMSVNEMTSEAEANVGAVKFNTILELPKLEKWFLDCPNPARTKLLEFMHILNRSNFRKHSTKITYQQICNWFSNARALQRKKETALKIKPDFTSTSSKADEDQTSKLNRFIQTIATSKGESPASDGIVSATSASTDLEPLEITENAGCRFREPRDTSVIHRFLKSSLSEESSNASPEHHTNTSTTDTEEQQSSTVKHELNNAYSDDQYLEQASGSSKDSEAEAMEESNCESFNVAQLDTDRSLLFKTQSQSPGIMSKLVNCFGQTQQRLNQLCNSKPPSCRQRCPTSECSEQSAYKLCASPSETSASEIVESILQNHSANIGLDDAMYRARSRLMFDPLSEVPVLEGWFVDNPHPTWLMIDQFTEELNTMPYRSTYPPVTPHNVKIWFKNRRAKNKRILSNSMMNELLPVSKNRPDC